MVDEIYNLVAVTPLVIIPGNQLDKGRRQADAGGGVENGGALVMDEVAGDNGVFGVADDALPALALGGFLHGSLDLIHGGGSLQIHGQVYHRHVGGGNAEGHAGELALEFRNDNAHSLGSAGGRGDDVVCRAAAAAPVLVGGAVNGLLGGGGGVHGGHEAVGDAILLMNHAGQGGQAVGGAGSVGNNRHVLGVLLMVDAHYEHRGFLVLSGGGNDNLLGAAHKVERCAFLGGKHAGSLGNVFSAGFLPRNFFGILAGINLDRLAVNDQGLVLVVDGNLALVLAMHRVITEHINHVIQVDERVVDGNHIHLFVFHSGTENQTANTAESVDTNFR